jgi:hypothetical protein
MSDLNIASSTFKVQLIEITFDWYYKKDLPPPDYLLIGDWIDEIFEIDPTDTSFPEDTNQMIWEQLEYHISECWPIQTMTWKILSD